MKSESIESNLVHSYFAAPKFVEVEPIAGLHSEPLLKDKKAPASMNSLPEAPLKLKDQTTMKETMKANLESAVPSGDLLYESKTWLDRALELAEYHRQAESSKAHRTLAVLERHLSNTEADSARHAGIRRCIAAIKGIE